MTRISIKFGHPNRVGERKVYIKVSHRCTEKLLPTEIFVSEKEIARNGTIKNFQKQHFIDKTILKMREKLYDMAIELPYLQLNASQLSRRLLSVGGDLDFFTFADEWLGKSDVVRKNAYKSMIKYVCIANNNVRKLQFQQINRDFLDMFSDLLKDKPAAKVRYFCLFKHLYKEAMKKYNTDTEKQIVNNPFEYYDMPAYKRRDKVRALTIEQLFLIYNYRSDNPKRQLVRDLFIFSFCTLGTNAADIENLTTYEDGYIKYERTKTKRRRADNAYIEIKLHPIAASIIEKYRGKDKVFDFSSVTRCRNFNHTISQHIRAVGKEVGIDGLQFYQARHTFATLSRNMMGFSKSDVDEALNHVGELKIADVYIKKDFSIINNNNMALLQRVFGE